jgi:hypothetical protein
MTTTDEATMTEAEMIAEAWSGNGIPTTFEQRWNVVVPYGRDEIGLRLDDQHEVAEFVTAVCGELMALRTEIAAMRKELRTERLVVVHPDDGRELVYTDVSTAGVVLTVAYVPVGDEMRSKVVMDSNDQASNVYVHGLDNIVGMLGVDVSSDETKQTADGTLLLEGVELYKPRGALPVHEVTTQLQLDVNHGVTLHHDHDLIGTVHFDAKVGR